MDSFLQLKSLIFSFCYGILYFYIAKYNLFLIKNLNVFKKYLVTLVMVIDSVLLYVYLIFKINHGYFHIYFFLMFGLGFWFITYFNRKIVKLCKTLYRKRK